MDQLDKMQNSVMMLFIGITSSYFSQLLGCKTQKLMLSNIYLNHLMEFISLYLTVSMSTQTPESPLKSLVSTLKYYLFFMMFTKMNIYFTVFSFCLMFAVTLIKNYISYLLYKDTNNEKEEEKLTKLLNKLHNLNNILILIILATIITGFILYFIKKKQEYGKDWSLMRFIFGYTGCSI